MKNIKTYEGFFDFFKKKNKEVSNEPVYLDDIKECLYDLTEDTRFDNSLDGPIDGVFNTYRDVFKIKSNLSLDSDYEQLGNDIEGLPEYVKDNMMAVRIRYKREEEDDRYSGVDKVGVLDDDFKRLLEICESKLKTYNCEVSYYVCIGNTHLVNGASCIPDEFKSIDKLFYFLQNRREILGSARRDSSGTTFFIRGSINLTMKITSPSKIIV
jgi:hypothetical protein